MTRLILSTSNIMIGSPAIIRKPGSVGSNLELTNALRSNFLAAKQDYSLATPTTHDHGNSKQGSEECLPRTQAYAWTAREGSDLFIPSIDWSTSGLSEERSQYDITVKLFYLRGADMGDRARHTTDAINLVLKELASKSIDLLIVSFPGMSFEGDCEWEADKMNAMQGNVDEEVQTWQVLEGLHNQGLVDKLGLAEFGSEKLAMFLSKVSIRPRVDQVNIKDCCNVPPPLLELARREKVELLTHNDCVDILPGGTLRELLGPGARGAGILAGSKGGLDGMKGDLTPMWVVKYTAVIRDRGVIENKGYFAAADLRE